MNDKYNPPRLNEDFTEEDFDRLLESKFGLDDDFSSEAGIHQAVNSSDKTPAPLVEQDTEEPVKEEKEEKSDFINGDAYDYTIPETKDAWFRLKTHVGELEEANQDLLNQIALRDEMEFSETSEEEVDELRQKLNALIASSNTEKELLIQKLKDHEAEIEQLIHEKEVVTSGFEREQSNLIEEIQKLKKTLNDTDANQKSFQKKLMLLEKEQLEQNRLAEDERQEMLSKIKRIADELKNKEQEIETIRQQSANQLKEKAAQVDKLMKEREQEFNVGVLALQKEKKVIMDELKEQLTSLKRYVDELEKEKEALGQTRDQLTMKVGLLEDEKRILNEQNIAMVKETQALKQQVKESGVTAKKNSEEMQKLIGQMSNLLIKS